VIPTSARSRAGIRGWRVVVVGVVIMAAGCTDLCPRRTARTDVVSRWLNCTDCVEGELDSVLALQHRRPSLTVQALGEALFEGPHQSRRDSLLRRLDRAYTRDSSGGAVPRQSRQAYSSRYLQNYLAVYRKRAAFALARIGTPAARSTLDSATRHGFPPGDSLRADVRQYLARMTTWTPPVALTTVP
jgi:hypothetical protein